MLKLLGIILLALGIYTTASFAKKKEPILKTWSGYLMDKMCSKRMIGNDDKATRHTKTCLTEENCSRTGYGIMTEKKFFPFDSTGNAKAELYLKSTPKESGFKMEVTGILKRNTIAVVELRELVSSN